MKSLIWQAAQIPAEIERTLSDAIDENGEIVNEIALAKLEALAREKTVSLEQLGSYVKEDLSVKINHLSVMIDSLSLQQGRLMKARDLCMKVIGELLPVGDRIKTELVDIKWHPTEAVIVDTLPELLPAQFQRIKTTCDADKKALKEALKSGEQVEGARIEKRYSLQVK